MSSKQATREKLIDLQLCPRFHQAIELIGRRWTGAIVQILQQGPLRFNELLSAVPGLSDRLLTERLRELESAGIVLRTVDPGPPVRVGYDLTPAGVDLDAALRALGEWAERWIKTP
ncbi:MAG: helix-turn-helix transcriptional regulator [Candidatus Eremiobacteraeota bacterium]|nr:helix-turn-helix transcriptional regulator [Candidatus Eremiobacteraeota bacterium]